MKRIMTLALLLAIVLSSLTVTAQSESPYEIPSTLKRSGSAFTKEYAANIVIPGESPTTGLPLEDQNYLPILVQIDNSLGGIPQWGIASADIMYEMPIQGSGWTRLTALFSDRYPDEAGPIRSGRVMHVDLREEWDAVWVNFGKQEEGGSDVREALRDYGVNKKGLAIDGIGNAYKDYFLRVKYHMAPHNVTVYLKNLREYILGMGYPFPLRPYKFSDDPQYGGRTADMVSIVHKGNQDTASDFVYREEKGGYLRYTAEGIYYDLLDPSTELVYCNVIVQRTKLAFNRHSMNPLLPDVVGNGACDIFIRGKYIAGNWVRNSLKERTVFLDEKGNEIVLARGKTWIVMTDQNTSITIRSTDDPSALQTLSESRDLSDETQDSGDPPVVLELGVDETLLNGNQKDSTPKSGESADDDKQNTGAASEFAEIPNDTEVNDSADEKNPALISGEMAENDEHIVETELEPAKIPVETQVDDSGNVKIFATVSTPNKGDLNLRKSESTRSKLIDKIKNGTLVQILSKGDEWTKILYEEREGFVMTVYLDFSAK